MSVETNRFRLHQMMALVVFALVGSAFADGRMVTVESFDRSTGEVTLSISAGSGADVDKALIAAWAPGDAGEDAAKWRKFASVGTVQDATTSVSFSVPSDWRSVSGAVRFFLMEKTAPYAKRFECITGNPGPWIDTGIVPDVETDASVTACYKMDMAPFGLSTVFYLFSNTLDTNAKAGYFVGFFGANPSIESAPRGSAFRELRLNKTGAYIDGDRYYTFDNPANRSGTAKYSMALFGRRDNGTGSIGKQQGSCSIAAARILTNGVPARVYVPCQTSGGVVTLYDRVTGTFSEVKGSGSFTAGTEVCPAPEDCGAVESATAATLFAPTLTPGEKDVAAGTVIVSIGGGHDEGFVLAVADTEDKGTVLSAWSKGTCVAKVPAGTDSVAATLPADWWRDGQIVRFFWMSATDHPYDYEAEWLYTAGSAYSNAGWIPTMETAFEVSAKGPADVCAFGLTENFYLFSNGGNFYYWGFFGESGNGHAGPQVGTDFITLRLAKNVATVNGISVPKASGEFNYKVMTKGNPTPFRCSYNGDSLTKTGQCWIKYAKTWENGDLVRDLVPCVTNGIAVFYDRAHGKCYGSAVSAKFEVGPAVIPVDTGNGDALAWSAAEPLALEEAIWDGGGTDTDLRTAGNWTSDKAPDLDNATVVPTFATGGTRASLGAPASVLGLKFALKNGFTVSGNSPNALSVGHGGITVEDDPSERLSTWRYANIACPIVVAEDQTWNLSTNGYRRLQLTEAANVSGAAERTITVDGGGCLGLAGENDFKGNFQLNGGTVKVLSRHKAFGSAEDGGKVYVNLLTKKLTCEFFGVVIDKPMFVTGGNDSVDNFVFRAYNGENCLVAAPLTLQTGGRLMAHVQDDTVCEGGMTLNADLVLQGSGKKLTFRGEPVSSSGKQIETWGVTDFHFYVPSNKVNFLIGKDGGTSCIHFWTNNVFHDYSSQIRMNSSTKMDLHGFSQNFARIEMDGTNNVIHSDAPANCFGYYNVGNVPDTVLKGKFTGKVNFVKSGGDKVTLDAKSTSLGILRAHNGPLVVSARASWAGTDVQVGTRETNRKPTLFLTHGESFDLPQKTKLTLTTSQAGTIYTADIIPVVNIAEGVTQKVKELWIDGTRLPGGTWGSSESPAENKDDVHFAGKGVLDVRGWGCVVIVQ